MDYVPPGTLLALFLRGIFIAEFKQADSSEGGQDDTFHDGVECLLSELPKE